MDNMPGNKLNWPEKWLCSCVLHAALQLLSEMQNFESEMEKYIFWVRKSTFYHYTLRLFLQTILFLRCFKYVSSCKADFNVWRAESSTSSPERDFLKALPFIARLWVPLLPRQHYLDSAVLIVEELPVKLPNLVSVWQICWQVIYECTTLIYECTKVIFLIHVHTDNDNIGAVSPGCLFPQRNNHWIYP